MLIGNELSTIVVIVVFYLFLHMIFLCISMLFHILFDFFMSFCLYNSVVLKQFGVIHKLIIRMQTKLC